MVHYGGSDYINRDYKHHTTRSYGFNFNLYLSNSLKKM